MIYREVLRQRGGIPLAVQHIAIKPLPENDEYQPDLVQVSPSKRAASGTVGTPTYSWYRGFSWCLFETQKL